MLRPGSFSGDLPAARKEAPETTSKAKRKRIVNSLISHNFIFIAFIADLNGKIILLTAENKELRENTCIKASCVLEQLNKGELIVQRMTLEEKRNLFDFMDLIFANFISRLNSNYTLTKTDLILATLLKVGFTTNQLMFVFDCERNSVYRMKLRLKEHLCIDKEKSLEEFILFF